MRHVLLLWVLAAGGWCDMPPKPNIVIIMADDMGYQDVGFRGSDIMTPNLDKLAAEGVILENHYVMPICSPTRSSLMSGRYPIRTGFWQSNLLRREEWGLRLNETTMPEMLQRNGYATHGVGKWHCGMYTWDHTPVKRGFDTFLGSYLGRQGYFNHKVGHLFDLREDYFTASGEFADDIRRDLDGVYNTDIFTDRAVSIIEKHDQNSPLFLYLAYTSPHLPLDVSADYLAKYTTNMTNQSSEPRRKYAAMISAMDSGIGEVVGALEQHNMRKNTIVIFWSDNGAVYIGTAPGSNYPLRGGKTSFFEGGVRSVAFVNSPLLEKTGYINTNLHHVVDWYKTFQLMVGDEPTLHSKPQLPLDGVNIWDSVSRNQQSGREEVLLNYRRPDMIIGSSDNEFLVKKRSTKVKLHYSGILADECFVLRWRKWKLFLGSHLQFGWSRKNSIGDKRSVSSVHHKEESQTLLFDLEADPREELNVAYDFPEIVEFLSAKAPGYLRIMTRINTRFREEDENVYGYKGVWYPWVEHEPDEVSPVLA